MLLKNLMLLFSLASFCHSQQDCHFHGQCSAVDVGTSETETYNECLTLCQSDEFCNYVTHFGRTNECLRYSDCLQIDTQCTDCYSGEATCPQYEPMCNQAGLCTGTLISEQETQSADECLRLCQSVPECQWYSYFTDSLNCVLMEDCFLFDGSCTTCVAGERECIFEIPIYTKLMIVSGFPSDYYNDVEIIDLSSTSQNCQKPPDSLGGQGQVGSFIDGKPMVCGGGTYTNECHFYERLTNSWREVPAMQDMRGWAAGVALSDAAWWVTGGFDGGNLQSTEIYSAMEGWSHYTDLPIGQVSHCFLRINATHFFLVGGEFLGQLAYLFDVGSNNFTRLDDASESNYLRTCGVVTRDNGENEIVVAGGAPTPYSQSTEIFSLSTMSWRDGPDLPNAVQLAFGVPYGSTFLAVGGAYGDTILYDTILKYDQVNDGWKVLPQRLSAPKGVYAAFMVPDEAVNCS